MKIFFVNTNKKWGGGEKWHLDTARAMSASGHDVSMISHHETDLYHQATAAGITTYDFHITNTSFLDPLRIWKLVRLFRQQMPDVVILNFSSDLKSAGIAAKMAGVRNIIYRRGNAKPIRDSFLNRLLFRNIVTRIIANSRETMKAILKNNRSLFPVEKITVLYNGIDLAHFDGLPADPLYQRIGNEIMIGSAGRLSHEKGQHLLIHAAAELKRRKLRFTMLIAGEGPLESELKQAASDAGVQENLVFMGFVSNIKSFMHHIDIFILPSLWEGFGYVTVEAMAAMKPVVAFKTGSNPEIIADRETGLLADCYDIADLCNRLEMLMINPELRLRMGRAGRKRAEERFDMKVAEWQFERFLLELVK